MYFFDTGLIAYLAAYSNAETLAHGAMSGSILENYVINEIRKGYHNQGKNCLMWYYRDFDQAEIDLVIETDGVLTPIKIKRTASPTLAMTKNFGKLKKGSVSVGKGAVICNATNFSALNQDIFVIPIWML